MKIIVNQLSEEVPFSLQSRLLAWFDIAARDQIIFPPFILLENAFNVIFSMCVCVCV